MMKKIASIYLSFILVLSGCGTFGMRQIRKSEVALGYAKQTFSKIDYKMLMNKMPLPPSEIKSVDPVHLYSTTNEFLSIEQNGWNYIQRVSRTDGLECYAAIQLIGVDADSFKQLAPGKLYCFRNEKDFSKTEF